MIRYSDWQIGLKLILKVDSDVVFEVIDWQFISMNWIIKNISKRPLLAWSYDLDCDIMEMSIEEINEKFDIYFDKPIDKLSWNLRQLC